MALGTQDRGKVKRHTGQQYEGRATSDLGFTVGSYDIAKTTNPDGYLMLVRLHTKPRSLYAITTGPTLMAQTVVEVFKTFEAAQYDFRQRTCPPLAA